MNEYKGDFLKVKTPLNESSKKKLAIEQAKLVSDNGNLYNMWDLNYFIKSMEKESLLSYNSMPVTPT